MKKFLILALSLLLLIVGIAGCSNITEVFGNPGISEKKTIFRQYNEDMEIINYFTDEHEDVAAIKNLIDEFSSHYFNFDYKTTDTDKYEDQIKHILKIKNPLNLGEKLAEHKLVSTYEGFEYNFISFNETLDKAYVDLVPHITYDSTYFEADYFTFDLEKENDTWVIRNYILQGRTASSDGKEGSKGKDNDSLEIVKFEIYRTEDEGQEPNISNSPPSFLQDETTYIDFKVYLEHSPQKREFQIVHKYIDPFGNIVGEYSDDYYTEEDWTESWHTGGSGWDEPGNWDEGFYRIKVTVENKRYISEIFEICKEIESDEA